MISEISKKNKKDVFYLGSLIVIIFIFIASLFLGSSKNVVVEDNLIYNGLLADDTGSVYTDGESVEYLYSTETLVSYANLVIKGMDFLSVSFDAETLDGSTGTIYVDICGGDYGYAELPTFNSTIYSDRSSVTGMLNLGTDHSDDCSIRVMTSGDIHAKISNICVTGWKCGRWSVLTAISVLLLSVWLFWGLDRYLGRMQRLKCVVQIVFSYCALYMLYTGFLITSINDGMSIHMLLNDLYATFYNLDTYTIMGSVVVMVMACTYIKFKSKKTELYMSLTSYIIAFFILSGYLYSKADVFFELLTQKVFLICALVTYWGLVWIVQYVLKALHYLIEKWTVYKGESVINIEPRKIFYYSWIAIFAAWLPYAVLRYPATCQWDAVYQLKDYFEKTISTFWSPISTWLMGFFPDMGYRIFGSYNLGGFLYIILQMLFCSAVFAYAVYVLSKIGIPKWYLIVAVCVCAFMPIYPSYITVMTKDMPYISLVMLYTVMLFELLIIDTDIQTKKCICLSIIAVLGILFSPKGIFYIVISTVGILLYYFLHREKQYKKILLFLLVAMIAGKVTENLINNFCIQGDTTNITLCQPLQQIANYVVKCKEDVTEEEREIIDQFLVYDNIEANYNNDLSDYIWNDTWRQDNTHTSSDWLRLGKVWLGFFFKHPEVCLDASLRCNYGFYYTGTKQWGLFNCGNYVGNPTNAGVPFIYSPWRLEAGKKLFYIIQVIEDLPIFFLLCNVVVHIWIDIYIFIWSICKRRPKFCICMLIPMVCFGLCMVGPTYFNGGVRYALFCAFINVFIIGYWIKEAFYLKSNEKPTI